MSVLDIQKPACNDVVKMRTKLEANFFEELEGTAWKKRSITRLHNDSLIVTKGMYRVIISMQEIERRERKSYSTSHTIASVVSTT
ncbi:hypothetical protein KXD40_005099 [Peronospora effusa]|nr:hypothetical protein KXD40_005099 [Peronospora effusa]